MTTRMEEAHEMARGTKHPLRRTISWMDKNDFELTRFFNETDQKMYFNTVGEAINQNKPIKEVCDHPVQEGVDYARPYTDGTDPVSIPTCLVCGEVFDDLE